MQVAVADLQLKVYTSTRTSKTDADLGKVRPVIMTGVRTHVLSRSGVHLFVS